MSDTSSPTKHKAKASAPRGARPRGKTSPAKTPPAKTSPDKAPVVGKPIAAAGPMAATVEVPDVAAVPKSTARASGGKRDAKPGAVAEAATSIAERAIGEATRAVVEATPASPVMPAPDAAPEPATAVAAPLAAPDPVGEASPSSQERMDRERPSQEQPAQEQPAQERTDPVGDVTPSPETGSAATQSSNPPLPSAETALDLADKAQDDAYAALDRTEAAMADAGRKLPHASAMTREVTEAVTATMADTMADPFAFYPGFLRAAGERAAVDMSEGMNALRRSGRATGETLEATSSDAAEVLTRARARAVDLARGQVADGHTLARTLMTARSPRDAVEAQTTFAAARTRAFAEAASAATADMMRFLKR